MLSCLLQYVACTCLLDDMMTYHQISQFEESHQPVQILIDVHQWVFNVSSHSLSMFVMYHKCRAVYSLIHVCALISFFINFDCALHSSKKASRSIRDSIQQSCPIKKSIGGWLPIDHPDVYLQQNGFMERYGSKIHVVMAVSDAQLPILLNWMALVLALGYLPSEHVSLHFICSGELSIVRVIHNVFLLTYF